MRPEKGIVKSMNKRVFKYVDLFKLLMAVLILLMHLNMFEHVPFGQLLKAATARLGVPYFFAASGFFFAKSLYNDGTLSCERAEVRSKRRKYIRRVATMLLMMEPVNILLRVVEYLLEGAGGKEILISVVRSVIFYPWGALWFLQGCIVAVLIITPFIIRGKEERLIVPALIAYAVLLLLNRCYFLIEGTALGHIAETVVRAVSSMRNGLTVGLPFMLAGVLIAKHWEKLLRRVKAVRLITVVCWLGLIAEAVITEPLAGLDDRGMFVFLIPLIPALFITTATVSVELKMDTVTARNLSTSIFLIHSPAISLVTVFQLILFRSADGGVIKAAAVMAVIAAVIALVYRNKNSKVFRYIT